MGKVSRYDGGDLPEDKKKKKKAPVKRVIAKQDSGTLPKKPRALSLQIRDVRRLMDRYKDVESQKKLSDRLDQLLRRSEYKAKRQLDKAEAKRQEDLSRKAKFLELKRLEKRLKKTDDEEVKSLILNDIEYIKTFPRGMPYLSLFSTDLDEAAKAKRDDLRKKAAIRRMTRASEGGEGESANDVQDDFFTENNDDDDGGDSE